MAAAFGRLCVETIRLRMLSKIGRQPLSCGCVLKRYVTRFAGWRATAAAFVRLCVETNLTQKATQATSAATFGWLCVETVFRREHEVII